MTPNSDALTDEMYRLLKLAEEHRNELIHKRIYNTAKHAAIAVQSHQLTEPDAIARITRTLQAARRDHPHAAYCIKDEPNPAWAHEEAARIGWQDGTRIGRDAQLRGSTQGTAKRRGVA